MIGHYACVFHASFSPGLCFEGRYLGLDTLLLVVALKVGIDTLDTLGNESRCLGFGSDTDILVVVSRVEILVVVYTLSLFLRDDSFVLV